MANERFRWNRIAYPVFSAVLVVCIILGWWWYSASPTIVLVVRHAEKASATAVDPHLSAAGLARAAELARVAGDAGVSAIFASEFLRTRETVAPLAMDAGISVVQIVASDVEALTGLILADHRGATVTVAGHSNTVPSVIAGLGATLPCPGMFAFDASGDCLIPDHQYDNLFVVTIPRWGRRSVVRLRYGVSTP